ncbi:bifunctional enoyl-CoA hydratase/phosphate acetyltransferase [candidate division KSB1 bacterium]|nr:bifunctional enoyl-CoA hydratase/phosphate acetyltransferase [candidate division KSB1 bacterium]
MINSFDSLLECIKTQPKKTVAVAMAEDEDVLQAISHAHKNGIADAVLVGNRYIINQIAGEHQIDIDRFDIIHADSEKMSVVIAIQLVREHLADILMKGKCSSATILRGVLDRDHGVRSNSILSHLAACETPYYHKLLFMSDGGMNISPDLDKKIAIIRNAIKACRRLGIRRPKVALISAIEKVNYEDMPCTRDAAIIAQMGKRNQIKNALIDGPLAFDNAISKRSCEIKNIDSRVGGEADILIMPNIESGNVFYKTLAYLGGAKMAGVILGAKVPIILTSRADTDENKYYSIAMAIGTTLPISYSLHKM